MIETKIITTFKEKIKYNAIIPAREVDEDVVIEIRVVDYDLLRSTYELLIVPCVVAGFSLQRSALHPGNFLTSHFRYQKTGLVSCPSIVNTLLITFCGEEMKVNTSKIFILKRNLKSGHHPFYGGIRFIETLRFYFISTSICSKDNCLS